MSYFTPFDIVMYSLLILSVIVFLVFFILEILTQRGIRIRIPKWPRLDNIFTSRRSPFSKQRKIEKGLVISLLTGGVAGITSYFIRTRDIFLSAITSIITIFIILIPFLLFINRKGIGNGLKKGGKKMVSISKSIWNNNFVFSVVIITLALIIFFALNPNLLSSRFIVSLLIGIPILIVLLLGGTIITASILIGKKKEGEEKISFFGENGIIRDVPSNHVWILRKGLSIFKMGSDPGEIEWKEETVKAGDKSTKVYVVEEIRKPDGYKTLTEGIQGYIPIYYISMGFVDLSPSPQDPKPITVNTKDNQAAIIDWRYETIVSDSVRYAIRVKTEDKRLEFETKRATAIFNRLSSQKTQYDLTHFTNDELLETGKKALDSFNEGIKPLGIQAIALDIKNIMPPQDVRDAAEYVTVSKERKKAATVKASEMNILIKKTGADPTKVVIADVIRGAVSDFVNSMIERFTKKGE